MPNSCFFVFSQPPLNGPSLNEKIVHGCFQNCIPSHTEFTFSPKFALNRCADFYSSLRFASHGLPCEWQRASYFFSGASLLFPCHQILYHTVANPSARCPAPHTVIQRPLEQSQNKQIGLLTSKMVCCFQSWRRQSTDSLSVYGSVFLSVHTTGCVSHLTDGGSP